LNTFESFKSQIYAVNDQTFDDIALQLFRFQAAENPVYKSYIQHLGVVPSMISQVTDIPFMPISFFKHHSIKSGAWTGNMSFTSSGTTGTATSTHEVFDLQFYLQHSERCFSHFFGDLKGYHFLALLPSYLERKGSSLIAMMDYFIKKSASPFSGFYLHNTEQLLNDIQKLKKDKSRKTVLWGVTFALLELAENSPEDLGHCLIFETGGMKGRRKEITRHELHAYLSEKFNVNQIYSEYGMTELFSQAYSLENEKFKPVPWMKVMGREITDPLNKGLLGETSGINVTDLANWHSIAFIETEDLGRVYRDGTFEILGRMDNSDVRGCNLLVE
jgi:phenylacetate-coenzyme A ligase PaaK-like adenylate-forming protein